MTEADPAARPSYADLKALFINCTLKRSPEPSNTQGLVDISRHIMEAHGVQVDVVRAIDHDIATGVWPDMTEHGWETDDWPAIFEKVKAADILVLAGPIWLGDNSSIMKQVHERLYGGSHLLNDQGQYLYYGRVGGCLITGNEDGIKHCAHNVLYTLQHIGYTIPPQADAGWIGEAGPGPSYLDPGSRRPRERLHQPQHHVHDLEPDAPGPAAQGRRRCPGVRQPAQRSGTPAAASTSRTRSTDDRRYAPGVVTSSTDDAIVAGVRSGDEAVFAQLLSDWSRSMLLLARTFVSTEASAEEVVQDTWLAVIRGIDGFEGRSSLRTWVYRILVNTAKKRGVRESRTVPWSSLGGNDGPRADRRPGAVPRRRRPVPRWLAVLPARSGAPPRAACWPARCVPRCGRRSTRCPTGSAS